MRKLWALIRLDLQILLNAMHAGSAKRPWAAWVLMAVPGALMAYLGTLMGWSLATVMAPVGVLDLLAPLLAVLCAAMNLVFTLFAARGLVFTGRDSDLMLSLPVPTLWVVLGKLLALMLENLLLTVLWMVPAGVAAALSGGGAAICWPTYLASLPALALLPTTLGLAGGWLLALASARVRRQALVGNLLSMALMIAVLAASMQVNRLAALMLENAGSVRALLHGWLLPAGLFGSAAAGSWPAAAGFWAICLGLFLLVSVLVSRQYQRILAGLAGRNVRADYRLSALKASGQFRALYQKEWARYTHSNIWLMNTAVGPVLAVGGCVWFAFSAEGRILAAQMGPEAAWAGAAPAGVVLSMCCTTCSSISLEGKNVWILQEAPLTARALFGAKAALNLTLNIPAGFLCTGLLAWACGLSAGQTAAMACALTFSALWTALYGLAVNLLLPKLDSPNDTVVVKQSAASMAGIFGSAGCVGAVSGAVWLARSLGLTACVWGASAALCLGCCALWRWLCTAGMARFGRL